MIMIMIMAATAVVMMMRVGVDEHGREPALDGDGHLARRLGVLQRERHDLGGEPHVVDVAEVMTAQPTLAVEQEKRRRALHLVGGHRLRQGLAVRLVDGDGERPAVLLHEGLERGRRLRLVVLEHSAGEHGHLGVAEAHGEARSLRQGVLDAACTASGRRGRSPPCRAGSGGSGASRC